MRGEGGERRPFYSNVAEEAFYLKYASDNVDV